MRELVTDQDLARARVDPTFREQLLAENLEWLLEALEMLRKLDGTSPEAIRQIREGAALAVRLAEKLQRTAYSRGPRAA